MSDFYNPPPAPAQAPPAPGTTNIFEPAPIFRPGPAPATFPPALNPSK
jgi:hypothetical protein